VTRALVVGAGIGGLAAAIALRRAGLEVEILEQAPDLREIGAGISLWANAIHALDALGVGDAIRAASVPYAVGGLRWRDGTTLASASVEELTAALGTPVIVMHRADLQSALLAAVPRSLIRLGARVARLEHDARRVAIVLDGGEVVSGDLIVGADGLHSVCRAALFGDEPARYDGCTAWRAVVPFDTSLVRASETWGGGTLFGQVPINRNRVYWYAATNAAPGGRSPHPKQELLQLFAGWHAPIADLIEAADDAQVLRNDIFDRPPVRRWSAERVTLLGDAAHPMTPFLGQGACQAIEDAVVLGACLGGATDVAAALRDYERRRVPRANAFVMRSRRAGQVARLRNPLLVAVRNALLKRVSPAFQARQLAAMIAGH